MFGGPEPLWRQWELACDYFDEDVESGYVRILQEMIAAGWSDPDVAAAVRDYLAGWHRLLTDVVEQNAERVGGRGGFRSAELGTLIGLAFIGAESMILLGFTETELPVRGSLRRIGQLIRSLEEGALQP
jgi:hypothetical protein